ncbi:hypothetical protein [Lacicoccus alkaliphilus]|uniref:Uncharacterized protein n=1 Tax=Lacicoccus alkaliphilus DSM 16010 TaxID=1123231 RepID=A0A1M7AC17_9BACL|nr:hypothetical protein [Salinicoccus alkaliphilus]SHL40294.1 hypothetical protein SAMN02745189_00106 [Salinicoccus alkaliphilus DSM 16010]
MNKSTHRSNLERMIELAEIMKGNSESDGRVEMVNEADLHQYDLMRCNGLAAFECSAAGGEWHFLSKTLLTERGQAFIGVFGDKDNYDGIRKLAKAHDERINDLSLDEVIELGDEYLKNAQNI